MALTNNGTAVFVDESLLPVGYTKPAVTKFTDAEYVARDVELSIAKSGVQNATATTTMANLVTAITAAVSAYITADYNVSGLTVIAFANLKGITTNNTITGVLFTNGAINYVVTVDIHIKTAAL